ncbi:MAG: hypothetical protein WB760_26415 [Xanthobacteraceae bacterium]
MTDIGRNIATAINGHLKALRHLSRKETTVADVAEALGLPDAIVERAFSEFKMTRAKIKTGHTRNFTKAHMVMSPVIELG